MSEGGGGRKIGNRLINSVDHIQRRPFARNAKAENYEQEGECCPNSDSKERRTRRNHSCHVCTKEFLEGEETTS